MLEFGVFVNPVANDFLLNDKSLHKPKKPDAVADEMLIGFCTVVMPLYVFILCYCMESKWRLSLKSAGLLFWAHLVEFFIVLFITDFIQIVFGRLRPTFISVCKPPSIPAADFVEYSSQDICTGDLAAIMKERRSFPSGHSTLSMTSAIFGGVCSIIH